LSSELQKETIRVAALESLILRMSFSDLPRPAEASTHTTEGCSGFAQAGNWYPLFQDMREKEACHEAR
jgi:hypothetical protein